MQLLEPALRLHQELSLLPQGLTHWRNPANVGSGRDAHPSTVKESAS